MGVEAHHAHPHQRHVLEMQRLRRAANVEWLESQLFDQRRDRFLGYRVPLGAGGVDLKNR